jgi:hypothetical protein
MNEAIDERRRHDVVAVADNRWRSVPAWAPRGNRTPIQPIAKTSEPRRHGSAS